MAFSILVLLIIIFAHLFAFFYAFRAEVNRDWAEELPNDDGTICVYTTDASTFYGFVAFSFLLVNQVFLNLITRCFCCGKGLVPGRSTTCAIICYILSWIGFLAAEACLLVGSTTSAYKTKYRGYYSTLGLSCSALRKGVFAVGAALTLFSMLTSILYYWAHCKADTADFWMRHHNEDIEMDTRNHVPQPERQ